MLLVGTTLANPTAITHRLAAGAWSVGQVGSNNGAARRREADRYLQLARQAMKESNLDLAEKHVKNAEGFAAKYDSLFARFQDTPEKVRRDLNAMRAKAEPEQAKGEPRPSNRFSPFNAQPIANGPGRPSQSPPQDPFSQRSTEAAIGTLAGNPTPPVVSPFNTGGPQASPRSPQRLPAIAGNAERATGSISDRAPMSGDGNAKAEALRLVAQSQAAFDRRDFETARRLAEQADRLDVEFGPGETRPWEVLLTIDQATRRSVAPAANFEPVQQATGQPGGPAQFPVRQGVYNPASDVTRNELAQAQVVSPPSRTDSSRGLNLYQQGLEELETQDRDAALRLFREAWKYQEELDPRSLQGLKDKLSLLGAVPEVLGANRREPSPLEAVNTQQELLRQKLFSELRNEEQAAARQLGTDPRGARERIQMLRDRMVQAELDPGSRKQLLTLVDRRLNDLDAYIRSNGAQIELDERNREVYDGVQGNRNRKYEIQDKIAQLVDQFNKLYEEQRFSEAELKARQVRELDPESPIARLLMNKSKLRTRVFEQGLLDEAKEQGFYEQLGAVDWASVPFNDREPLVFGDVRKWNQLSDRRQKWLDMQRRRLSPVELGIQQKLSQNVEVQFINRPLSEVLDTMASMAGVNIYADVEGMAAEGVTTDTPVTINLTQPVMLKSALNLILEPLRLSYVIQHEVLRITSEQARDANTFAIVYNVADLIIPIPNFVPGYNVGLPAAIREAHRQIGYGGVVQPVSMGPLTIAANELDPASRLSSGVLAQTNAHGMLPNSGTRPSMPLGSPGSMGGAALADFDSLIDLITSTTAPESWDAVGGPGAIESFATNLSLVISQTQDVHDQIADLLEQLRRLQDLQVTIEVRFITLRENFFERVGVDFDFDIDDNVIQLPQDDSGSSVSIGLDQAGNPTADLDLSFTQGSFGLSTPPFGAAANSLSGAGNFGFAILSDIEAFFLIQAASGDTRSNILQAPKVTLFNGQQASVSDTSQRPFVTSLIPVVGDFAAAHQPVIVVLNEGTSLSVQAVVSSDRRFVRLTLVPVFSQIGNVDTFTFSGRTTSNTGTNVTDPDGNPTGNANNSTSTTEGTTVQLPTFSFTTVSTTVSVPDGGTVLLGGIKRLSEGRTEQGIPMLSKIPYVSRLFRNVGIGRDTTSLMLMVTPRIIIQEEEELKLGI